MLVEPHASRPDVHGKDGVWYDITAIKGDVRHYYERERELVPMKRERERVRGRVRNCGVVQQG